MIKLVIFDLDGTVLNTISDLGNSTNYALKELGYPVYDIPSYRFRVGNGINKLFERALPDGEKSQENVLRVRKLFLPHYTAHCTDMTHPYDGIPELLNKLKEDHILMAIASNKYQEATSKLINHFYADIPFVDICGQRDGIMIKPDPAVVYHLIDLAQVDRSEVLYIGDSGVDMQTAVNADVTSCGVTWGFRPLSELTENGAVYIANHPNEIYKLICHLDESI